MVSTRVEKTTSRPLQAGRRPVSPVGENLLRLSKVVEQRIPGVVDSAYGAGVKLSRKETNGTLVVRAVGAFLLTALFALLPSPVESQGDSAAVQVGRVMPNVKHQEVFLKLQQEAREGKQGLWGQDP